MTTDTVADEIEEIEEGEAPKRRARAAVAFPAEAIPAEISSAFLADLAFERAISTALGLASGLNRAVAGLSGVSGPKPVTTVHQPAGAALCALERAVSTAHDLAL